MIEVVPASPRHVNRLAQRMREIDQLECLVSGVTPKNALRWGVMASTMSWTLLIDGEPEAMFGATTLSLLDGKGRPWLLMSDKAALQHKALVRLGAIYTEAMHRNYSVLYNFVHADNDTSIRWLARLGYAIGAVDVINGQPMRPFVRCVYP